MRARLAVLAVAAMLGTPTHAGQAGGAASATSLGALDTTTVHTENDGRRYRVERVPKSGAKYERLDKETLRYLPYATYKIAGEDANYFYVKQYVVDAVPVSKQKVTPQPAAEKVEESQRFKLQDFGSGLPQTDQWRDDFALADMNGDGHLDIISTPARKTLSAPVVFLGDGKGNWRRWREAKFPALPYDYGAVTVADFNGDGMPDIALAMHLRGLAVLTGDGKGNFSRYDKNLPLGTAGGTQPATYSSHIVDAYDWNGDGKPDLIAVNEGMLAPTPDHRYPSGINVFLNAAGSWSPVDPPQADRPASVYAVFRARAAAKRPGPPLILGTSREGRFNVYEVAVRGLKARPLDELPAGAIVRAAAAADLDGDGRADLVIAYQLYAEGAWRALIDVYYANASGYRRRGLHSEAGKASIGAVALAHLSGSATWDLVALRGAGSMLMFASDGHGFFTRDHVEPAPEWRAGCAGTAVHAGDLDGDGVEEIVATFAGVPNALALRRDCVNGGGIAAWRVSTAASKAPH